MSHLVYCSLYAAIVFDFDGENVAVSQPVAVPHADPVDDGTIIFPSQPPPLTVFPVPSSPVLPPPLLASCEYPSSPGPMEPCSPQDRGLCPKQPPPTLVLRCQSPVLPPPIVGGDLWPQSPLNRPIPCSPRSIDFIVSSIAGDATASDGGGGGGGASEIDSDPLYLLAYKLCGSRESFYNLSEEERDTVICDAFDQLPHD